jgi:hypothetical protein
MYQSLDRVSQNDKERSTCMCGGIVDETSIVLLTREPIYFLIEVVSLRSFQKPF